MLFWDPQLWTCNNFKGETYVCFSKGNQTLNMIHTTIGTTQRARMMQKFCQSCLSTSYCYWWLAGGDVWAGTWTWVTRGHVELGVWQPAHCQGTSSGETGTGNSLCRRRLAITTPATAEKTEKWRGSQADAAPRLSSGLCHGGALVSPSGSPAPHRGSSQD